MSTAVKIEGLSKKYVLRHEAHQSYSTLRDAIGDAFLRLRGRSTARARDEFWALQDVTLSVGSGERVGIIGRNGAGKSTLLKIISRITVPTRGRVSIRGRVASLLEVGTGFHPELTGRENIQLNGSVLGMTRAEIRRKFDEIVEFAEVARFLDTPVKHFSSGMYVRLAFAVAAHLEPEILIVDEVLAVGDAQFQRKCLGRMEQVGREGRTVLFVSHNMPSIRALCPRTVFLQNGVVAADGETSSIIETYLTKELVTNERIVDLTRHSRSAGKEVAIRRCWFEDASGEIVRAAVMGSPFRICFEFSLTAEPFNPGFGFGIETMDGMRLFTVNNYTTSAAPLESGTTGVARCEIPEMQLLPGTYLVSLSVVENQNWWLDYIERAVAFEVLADDVFGTGKMYERSQGIFYSRAMVTVSDR